MPKTGQPDTSDAQVMIALYEAQAAHNLGEVMGYIWSNDFPTDFREFRQRFERGSNSSEEQSIQRALGYFETIGTLHRNNLINEDLVFDWIAIDMAWGRLKGFVGGIRRETANARMYENFEYMARRKVNWKPARSRPAAAAKRPAAKRPAAKRAPAAKRTRLAAKRTRPTAARTRPATKRGRPATKKARPAAKRTAAATRTRPTAAKRTRPAAKRTRAAARRTRPVAKKARPATKKARPAPKKAARPAAKRTAAANRARPAAKRPAAAARGRATARRTPAARKRG